MSVEPNVEFIADLDPTQPPGAPDTLAEADDHLRNIKKGTQGSFPQLGRDAVTATANQINLSAGRIDEATGDTKIDYGTGIAFENAVGSGVYDVKFNVDSGYIGKGAVVLNGMPLEIKPKSGEIPALIFNTQESGGSFSRGTVSFYIGASALGHIGMDSNSKVFMQQGSKVLYFDEIYDALHP